MDAGRWIAQDRGALETEADPEIAVPPPAFPLADRLSQQDFDALMRLRGMLPKENGPLAEASSPVE